MRGLEISGKRASSNPGTTPGRPPFDGKVTGPSFLRDSVPAFSHAQNCSGVGGMLSIDGVRIY